MHYCDALFALLWLGSEQTNLYTHRCWMLNMLPHGFNSCGDKVGMGWTMKPVQNYNYPTFWSSTLDHARSLKDLLMWNFEKVEKDFLKTLTMQILTYSAALTLHGVSDSHSGWTLLPNDARYRPCFADSCSSSNCWQTNTYQIKNSSKQNCSDEDTETSTT